MPELFLIDEDRLQVGRLDVTKAAVAEDSDRIQSDKSGLSTCIIERGRSLQTRPFSFAMLQMAGIGPPSKSRLPPGKPSAPTSPG
jgi:hypothetical protein